MDWLLFGVFVVLMFAGVPLAVALGLAGTAVIMVAGLVAGLIAGAGYIWYRSRRAITLIEARGHQHNLFRS